jgi:hypothetical protein
VSLPHSKLSDVTFKSVGDFSISDWVTIIVSALTRPALLATLRVLHVRAHTDDATTLFSRNTANFLAYQYRSLWSFGLDCRSTSLPLLITQLHYEARGQKPLLRSERAYGLFRP